MLNEASAAAEQEGGFNYDDSENRARGDFVKQFELIKIRKLNYN